MLTIGAIIAAFLMAASSPKLEFESELWPGEGTPVLVAGSRQVTPRREPLMNSAANPPLTVKVGSRIQFDETRYQTIHSGLFVVESTVTLVGRKLGALTYLSKQEYYSGKFSARDFSLQTGATIEFLQYRAEGSCLMRLEREVVEVEQCPDLNGPGFRSLRKAEVLWWVRVIVAGKPRGWALVDGRTLRVSRREF